MLVECITREQYSKKLIVVLPGQRNPEHYHSEKDETFQILYGNVDVFIDGKEGSLGPGDTFVGAARDFACLGSEGALL